MIPVLLQRCLREYDKILSSYTEGLTRQQLNIMEAVAKVPKTQAALIKATGVDRSTVSELVRRLEKQGMVTRTRGQLDRRVIVIDTTPLGRSRMKDVRLASQISEDELLRPLGPDRDKLEALLVRALEHQQPKRPHRIRYRKR